jgi:chemotaxis protein CheX
MSLQAFISQSICRSASQVFSTMLGVELGEGEISIENGMPGGNHGIMSFIGLAGSCAGQTGTWAGTGCLTCSPEMACRICSLMLMTETTSVNEDVLDAVAEATNMIIGSVKTELEKQLGPLGLSIPTVVFGRNFSTRSAGHAEWIVVRFRLEEEPLVVRMFLAPTEKVHMAPHAATQACALEI